MFVPLVSRLSCCVIYYFLSNLAFTTLNFHACSTRMTPLRLARKQVVRAFPALSLSAACSRYAPLLSNRLPSRTAEPSPVCPFLTYSSRALTVRHDAPEFCACTRLHCQHTSSLSFFACIPRSLLRGERSEEVQLRVIVRAVIVV